jgi:Fe-S-cluster containining protein
MASKEEKRNPCLETRCSACCRDAVFPQMSQDEFDLIAPPGTPRKEISKSRLRTWMEELLPLRRQRPAEASATVLFVPYEDGISTLVLAGNCPNLTANGACGIYERRPKMCRTLKPADPNCTNARLSEGLEPIPAQWGRKSVLLPMPTRRT